MKRPIIILYLIFSASLYSWAQWPDLTRNGLRDGYTNCIDFADTVTVRECAIWDLSQCSTGSVIKVVLTQPIDSVPLHGITSITDPAGKRTSYEYDGFGRLVMVIDCNGATIEEYDYSTATSDGK